MNPERWEKIKGILATVLDTSPAERARYLDRSCGGDDQLRRDVELLLASERQADSQFMGETSLEQAAIEVLPQEDNFCVGRHVGHYQIVERIGAGGMGEVYRAHDQSLARDVAIKVLPPDLARNPERLARFRREAKALAQIDYPSIVTIHSVEEFEGVHFLVMQLIEGQTLDQLIPANGLALERIVEIGSALAEALAAAHEKGIIHRDLKPTDQQHLFVTRRAQGGTELLHLDLKGSTQSLYKCTGWGCFGSPSPDGRYLAILDHRQSTNMWMMENF